MRSQLIALIACFLSSSALAADIELGPPLTVAPGGAVPLAVLLTNPAGPGGVTVTLASSNASKVAISPESVYIPYGFTTPFGQPRVTGINFGTATISASAFGLAGGTQNVQVAAVLSGPPAQALALGTTLNVNLALAWPVPSTIALNVRSDNPAVAGVPSSASIPAGSSVASIAVKALAPGTSLLHIGAPPDVAEFTLQVTVYSPGTIRLAPVALTLGQSLPLPVTLASPAAIGGVTVTLASSNPAVKIAPASVFITAGQTAPAAQPEIAGENIGLSSVTASAPGYQAATLSVPVTASITMSPGTLKIPVGGTQVLSMLLSAAAPSVGVPITPDRAAGGYVNGLTVNLSSSDPQVASVQPTVQFYPDGSSITTVVVIINGHSTGTAVIHAGVPPYIPDVTATVIVGTPAGGAASLTAVGGTPQTAQVGAPFGLPLSVGAADASGTPVSGVTVSFSAPLSGPGASFAGGINTAVTDSSGIARSRTLTANGLPGSYQVTASAAGVAVPAAFTLSNAATAPGAITLPATGTIAPGQPAPYPIGLTVAAPAGGLTVSLSSSDPAKAAIAPSTVFVPAGAVAPSIQPVLTGVNFGSATIGATASGYVSASRLVQVGATLAFTPPALTISGPGSQNLTLTLSVPAPAGGLAVTLTSSNAAVASTPATLTFPAGVASIGVPVNGIATGTTVIKASAGAPNVPDASASVTVGASSDISFGPGVNLAPGEVALLPVFLTSPARSGGVTLGLASSDTSKLTINPDSIYIPGGSTTPFSQARMTAHSPGSVTVTASGFGVASATEIIQIAGRLSGPSGQTITAGSTVNLMFALSWPTNTALTLTVTSANPAIARVPATVVIPANTTTVIVPVTGLASGATTIRVGALPNIAESTVAISVNAPGAITLSSGLTLPLGQASAFTVSLGAPAPAGGTVVALSSSDANTVSITPTSVFISAGATLPATQPVVTARNIGAAAISASAPGYATASQSVAVTATITMSPPTLTISPGGTGILAMVLSSAAPSSGPVTPDRGAGGFVEGLTVNLSSSNSTVASVQPTVQFYSDGSSVTTVVVVISGISPGTAVIHASALPSIPDVTATVTVR
ncbi:MAG: hypothetical protein ABI806_03960 [Candidatus Solibacter sp.]